MFTNRHSKKIDEPTILIKELNHFHSEASPINNIKVANDIIETRCILDFQLSRFAAQRRTLTDLENIAFASQQLTTISKSGDLAQQTEADIQFHLAIAEAAHNDLLNHLMKSIIILLRKDIYHNIKIRNEEIGGIARLLQEHKVIYNAILCGNADDAGAALKVHVKCFEHGLS